MRDRLFVDELVAFVDGVRLDMLVVLLLVRLLKLVVDDFVDVLGKVDTLFYRWLLILIILYI